MILNCGPTKAQLKLTRLDRAKQRYGEWHTFFAFLPHRVDATRCVWLQKAERRFTSIFIGQMSGSLFITCPVYRLIGSNVLP